MADFEENVEEMVGTTREKTAATAGDERDGGGGVMYTDERMLEFDENERAALEGQRLVAEFTR